jgi:hypothetical protein
MASNGAQRLRNDALIFLGVRRHGCVLLTRNVADFNLFQQLVPDDRALFYRVSWRDRHQSKGPLPGSGPEPFVNDGWA